jgi:hypothetical protein
MKHQRLLLVTFIALFIGVLLVGCTAALRSKHLTKSSQLRHKSALTYFLPMTQIHLVVTFQQEWKTNLLEKPILLPQTFKTNSVVTTSDTTNTISTQAAPPAQPVNPAGPAPAPNIIGAKINRTVKGKVNIQTLTNAVLVPHIVCRIQIDQVTVPDPSRCYLLELNPKLYSEDDFKISVDTNGFLSSINVTNADKTADILKTVASTAIEALKLVNGAFAALDKRGKPQQLQNIELLFDPTNDKEVTEVNNVLKQVAEIKVAPLVDKPLFVYRKDSIPAKKTTGIFHRPALPYKITIETKDEIINKIIMAPNEAPTVAYEIRRAPLVTSSTALTFKNGFLTDASYHKPSELLAGVTIPLEILKMVTSIPTNLIQFKMDISSAQAKLYQGQTNEASSYLGLLQAQQRLDDYIRTNKTVK